MKINSEVISSIKEANNIALFIHIKPDGDCIGSAIALQLALAKMGKKSDIFCDDIITSSFDFMKTISDINAPKIPKYDLAIALDTTPQSRMGKHQELFKSIAKTIKIDHHMGVDNYANINFVEHVSSVGFIMYYLIKELDVAINQDIATALYTAIASDTGCFQHGNTTATDHEIAAELIKTGFDLEQVNNKIFKMTDKRQLELKKKALTSLKFFLNDKLAIMSLTERDFNDTDTTINDTHSIIDLIAIIDGCEASIMMSEFQRGVYKCSVRSIGKDTALRIAESFGGGGHGQSAGFRVYGGLHSAIAKIIKACEKIV